MDAGFEGLADVVDFHIIGGENALNGVGTLVGSAGVARVVAGTAQIEVETYQAFHPPPTEIRSHTDIARHPLVSRHFDAARHRPSLPPSR